MLDGGFAEMGSNGQDAAAHAVPGRTCRRACCCNVVEDDLVAAPFDLESLTVARSGERSVSSPSRSWSIPRPGTADLQRLRQRRACLRDERIRTRRRLHDGHGRRRQFGLGRHHRRPRQARRDSIDRDRETSHTPRTVCRSDGALELRSQPRCRASRISTSGSIPPEYGPEWDSRGVPGQVARQEVIFETTPRQARHQQAGLGGQARLVAGRVPDRVRADLRARMAATGSSSPRSRPAPTVASLGRTAERDDQSGRL